MKKLLLKVRFLSKNKPVIPQIILALFFALLLASLYELLFVSPYYIILLAFLCGILLLLTTSKHTWLYIYVTIIPFYIVIPMGSSLHIGYIILLPLSASLLFHKEAYIHSKKTKILSAEFFLLLFLFVGVFLIIQSVHIPTDWSSLRNKAYEKPFIRSIIMTTYLSICFFSSIIITHSISSRKILNFSLALYLTSGSIIATLSLYGYATQYFPSLSLIPGIDLYSSTDVLQIGGISLFPRLKGPCLEPVLAGRFFGSFVFISLLFFQKHPKASTLLSILFTLCVVFTYSRGAWLTLIISGTLFVILKTLFSVHRLKICFFLFVLSIIIFIGITVAYFTNPFIAIVIDKMILNNLSPSETFILKDISASIRVSYMILAKRIFLEHPFLGVGIGNIIFHSHIHFVYVSWITDTFGETTASLANSYAELLAETGLLGSLLYLSFLLSCAYKLILLLVQSSTSKDKHINTCVACLFLLLVIHPLFFSLRFLNYWLLFGFIFNFLHQKELKTLRNRKE